MTTQESVLWAFRWLLDQHRRDVMNSSQVNMGMLPFAGHGDDIWFRTEHSHIVAEVTQAGTQCTWANVNPATKRAVRKKLNKLRDRPGATHKYLFIPESYAASVRSRDDVADVNVIGLPV